MVIILYILIVVASASLLCFSGSLYLNVTAYVYAYKERMYLRIRIFLTNASFSFFIKYFNSKEKKGVDCNF